MQPVALPGHVAVTVTTLEGMLTADHIVIERRALSYSKSDSCATKVTPLAAIVGETAAAPKEVSVPGFDARAY